MDRFKLILDFRTGVTAGDRNALLDQLERDVISQHDLEREELRISDRQIVIVYRFTKALRPDTMHDACRAIFRYLRARGRALEGIGISDRSWWKPTFTPGAPDPVDPLDPGAP